jgi:hypothetical protein
MMMGSASIDQLSALVELIKGKDFLKRLEQLKASEQAARKAETDARVAKAEAEAALKQIAKERAEVDQVRRKIAEDLASYEAKFARLQDHRGFLATVAPVH